MQGHKVDIEKWFTRIVLVGSVFGVVGTYVLDPQKKREEQLRMLDRRIEKQESKFNNYINSYEVKNLFEIGAHVRKKDIEEIVDALDNHGQQNNQLSERIAEFNRAFEDVNEDIERIKKVNKRQDEFDQALFSSKQPKNSW